MTAPEGKTYGVFGIVNQTTIVKMDLILVKRVDVYNPNVDLPRKPSEIKKTNYFIISGTSSQIRIIDHTTMTL